MAVRFMPTGSNIETNKVPPLELESLTAGGATFKPKGQDQKNRQNKISDIVAQENAKRQLRAPFEVMSANDQDKITAMADVGGQLQNVRSLVGKLEPGYVAGIPRKIQLSSEYLQDPKLTELNSAYGLLTSTLLKQFQGSRPSDFDYRMWEIITGKKAVTKENMLSALDYANDYANQDKSRKVKIWSRGYKLPEKDLWDIVNAGNDNAQPQNQGVTQSDKFQTFNIKNRTYKIPINEVVQFKKDMGIK